MASSLALSAPSRALTQLDHLVEVGLLTPQDAPALNAVSARYALAITPTMAALAAQDAAIARQFVPDLREMITHPEEREDPIGDHIHSPVKGVVHRYPDRVLVKLTHTCPVYCRFCFRREMVGPDGDGNLDEAELDAAFAYIAVNPQIFEVIFTGGDPLMLSPRRITALGERLKAIPHVKLVRWHSRVPVVAPERITDALAQSLMMTGKANYVAIHANACAEFTVQAEAAIAKLAERGIVLLGQTVLLKGVNDEVSALLALLRVMVQNRITPLYLHHPDLAPGTAHFRMSLSQGQALYAALRGQLSGHAIPTYVLDIPGGFGKVPVNADTVRASQSGTEIRDSKGVWHAYPD